MGPVAIIGIGLMGGSLGLALRQAGVGDVRGVDADGEALAAALDRGAITSTGTAVEDVAPGAAVVAVAAPVPAIPDLVARALAVADPGCLVTDLGSAKRAVVDAVPPGLRDRFIGGHPICGAETSGVVSGRAEPFPGAPWFLTPTPECRGALYERAHGMVAAVGAVPVAIDAAVHDRLMALVSHTPHVLAAALIHQAGDTTPEGREALRSAGPSFQDLTRVAGSNPPLWADILLANDVAVLEALHEFGVRLDAVADAVRAGDRQALLAFFSGAVGGRQRLRAPDAAPPLDEAWELSTAIPDRPGAVSDIVTALGHAHINIRDLTLHPGPPGGLGELVLRVPGHQAAAEAERLIAGRGYAVRRTAL